MCRISASSGMVHRVRSIRNLGIWLPFRSCLQCSATSKLLLLLLLLLLTSGTAWDEDGMGGRKTLVPHLRMDLYKFLLLYNHFLSHKIAQFKPSFRLMDCSPVRKSSLLRSIQSCSVLAPIHMFLLFFLFFHFLSPSPFHIVCWGLMKSFTLKIRNHLQLHLLLYRVLSWPTF